MKSVTTCLFLAVATAALATAETPRSILKAAVDQENALVDVVTLEEIARDQAGQVYYREVLSHNEPHRSLKLVSTYHVAQGRRRGLHFRVTNESGTWDLFQGVALRVPRSMLVLPEESQDASDSLGSICREAETTYRLGPDQPGGRRAITVNFTRDQIGRMKRAMQAQATAGQNPNWDDFTPARCEFLIDERLFIIRRTVVAVSGRTLYEKAILRYEVLKQADLTRFYPPDSFVKQFPRSEEEYAQSRARLVLPPKKQTRT